MIGLKSAALYIADSVLNPQHYIWSPNHGQRSLLSTEVRVVHEQCQIWPPKQQQPLQCGAENQPISTDPINNIKSTINNINKIKYLMVLEDIQRLLTWSNLLFGQIVLCGDYQEGQHGNLSKAIIWNQIIWIQNPILPPKSSLCDGGWII